MDERLEAGRHHLRNGEASLSAGNPSEGRMHFEAALLQFRGPELRLGEGHACRGLARACALEGDLENAERLAVEATAAYRDVRVQLARLDSSGVSAQMQRDAEESEAATLVFRAELMLRVGRDDDADDLLESAGTLFGHLGGAIHSAAALFSAKGRHARREGDLEAAEAAYLQAVNLHQEFGFLAGQAESWLDIAEVRALAGSAKEANAVDLALKLAEEARRPDLAGRAWQLRGRALARQGNADGATDAFGEALALLDEGASPELAAFAHLSLAELKSREGRSGVFAHLREALVVLGGLGHVHGVGATLLAMSEHALRTEHPRLALASAEAARRLWRAIDPIRGVGQVMRIQVKSLAALRRFRDALTVATARASLVGDSQPNAAKVRQWYRERAPEEWLKELDALDERGVAIDAERRIVAALRPLLEELSLPVSGLGSKADALVLLDALAAATPIDRAALEGEDDIEEPDFDEQDAGYELIGAELEEPQVLIRQRTTEVPPEAVETDEVTADLEVDTASLEAETAETPASAGLEGIETTAKSSEVPAEPEAEEYEGLYAAPEEAQTEEPAESDDGTEEEPVDPKLAALQAEAPPDEYAGLYSFDETKDD